MIIAVLISLAAFILKYPAFGLALTGYFGSYQATNAMMAEMMGGGSFVNLFIPRTFILMGDAPGLHLLYYPFASLAAFLLDRMCGGGIPWWGRFQAGIFVLGATVLLYPAARRFLDEKKSLLSVFFFSFFPLILLSGISFQNEASALFFLMLSFVALDPASSRKSFMSGLVFSLALTARIHFAVALPAYLIFLNQTKFSLRRTSVFLLGVVLPIAAWIFWIRILALHDAAHIQTCMFSQLGEGRILVASLFGSPNFYKRILEILGTSWCTPVLFPFALIGLLTPGKERISLLAWIWGSISLIILLPQKVMDHPFYLIVGSPALAILSAFAIGSLWDRWGRFLKCFFCLAFILLAMRYYLPSANTFTAPERDIARIGSLIKGFTGPSDKIIVDGESAGLLYYSRRTGWPFDMRMAQSPVLSSKQERFLKMVREGYGDPLKWVQTLRGQGASYFFVTETEKLTANPVFYEFLNHHYHKIDAYLPDLLIYDLRDGTA